VCLLCESKDSRNPRGLKEPANTIEADDLVLYLDDPAESGVVESVRRSETLLWFSEVFDISNGEFIALGSFVSSETKTRIIHQQCGYEYDITPHEWRSGRRCWRCSEYELDPSDHIWRREVDADMDRYSALGTSKADPDKKLIQHDACLYKIIVTPQQWRDGIRCHICPPILGRMHKTINWRREVHLDTGGEYKAIGDYARPDRDARVVHKKCGYEWGVRPGNWRARKSRCPQCAKSTGDNDAVYIWQKPDRHIDSRIIVKVGTTSWRLGHERIKKVAALHNTQADILAFKRVAPGTATKVEATILQNGDPLDYSIRIDGSTEFRIVTHEELENMMKVLSSARVD